MATKDDTESFTVAVVALTPAKFDIISYTITPTPPVVRGTTILITTRIKNVGESVGSVKLVCVDVDTGEEVSSTKYRSVAAGNYGTMGAGGVMPPKDWKLRLEAWRE